MVSGVRGEGRQLIGTDRSGIELWWIDRSDVSEEAVKFVAETVSATTTAMEEMVMIKG